MQPTSDNTASSPNTSITNINTSNVTSKKVSSKIEIGPLSPKSIKSLEKTLEEIVENISIENKAEKGWLATAGGGVYDYVFSKETGNIIGTKLSETHATETANTLIGFIWETIYPSKKVSWTTSESAFSWAKDHALNFAKTIGAESTKTAVSPYVEPLVTMVCSLAGGYAVPALGFLGCLLLQRTGADEKKNPPDFDKLLTFDKDTGIYSSNGIELKQQDLEDMMTQVKTYILTLELMTANKEDLENILSKYINIPKKDNIEDGNVEQDSENLLHTNDSTDLALRKKEMISKDIFFANKEPMTADDKKKLFTMIERLKGSNTGNASFMKIIKKIAKNLPSDDFLKLSEIISSRMKTPKIEASEFEKILNDWEIINIETESELIPIEDASQIISNKATTLSSWGETLAYYIAKGKEKIFGSELTSNIVNKTNINKEYVEKEDVTLEHHETLAEHTITKIISNENNPVVEDVIPVVEDMIIEKQNPIEEKKLELKNNNKNIDNDKGKDIDIDKDKI